MKAINEKEFLEKFMIISQDLTMAETRMLYLLITEPYLFDLPQQILANRLHTHRRTINIGLKKIKEFNYVIDSMPLAENVEKKHTYKENPITKHDRATAIQVILNSFEEYYPISKKNFITNEDFFSFILGDIKVSINYRHNKSFIANTIREKYPEIRFYFDLKKSSYENENTYYVIRLLNSEIIRAQNHGEYRLDIDEVFQKIYDGFLVDREESMRIIKSQFPKIRITNSSLSMRSPNNAKLFK